MLGNAFEQDRKVLRDLLWLDKFRGHHSTGLAVIDKKDNNVHMFKKVGTPDKLFNAYEEFNKDDVYSGPEGKMFIGHNRWATKGEVNDKNAHPFHHETIVGAHNGTLRSVYQLDKGHTFDVDSEAIFYNLNQAFDNEKVISKINGAYALVWYDNITDSAHFIRNKERPLYYTRRKDNEVIYWASLPWMLETALAYNNVQHTEIVPFFEDALYTFDLSYKNVVDLRKTNFERTDNVKGWVQPPLVTKIGPHTNIGGKSNAVNPFPPKHNNVLSHQSLVGSMNSPTKGVPSRTKEEKTKMKALQGKEIRFRFECEKVNEISNTPYLKAYFVDPSIDYEIRVFGAGHEMWDSWKKTTHFTSYTATVKRMVENNVRGKKNCYLLIDMRTINPSFNRVVKSSLSKEDENASKKTIQDIKDAVEKALNGGNDNEQMYEGFNGRWLTKEEWDEATGSGCAGCTQSIQEGDENIKFIDYDSCLCGGCASSDAYKGIVANMK